MSKPPTTTFEKSHGTTMPLESASFINGLDPSNPAAGDTMSQADDHIRLIKTTVKATFPNVTGAITVDHAFLNSLVARIEQLEAGNYIGRVTANAGPTTPTRHLLCHGQEVSRSTYALLFSAIGTAWGSGNGTTTFNVPDLRGRVLAGLDNMGGTDAARLGGVMGATARNLGGTGGNQWLQAHNHGVTDTGHVHTGTTTSNGAHTHTGSTDTKGGTGTVSGLRYSDSRSATGIFSFFTQGNVWDANNGAASAWGFTLNTTHSHNFTTSSEGAHDHTFTTASATTGLTVDSHGTGTSQNIQPVAMVNYVIFAGA